MKKMSKDLGIEKISTLLLRLSLPATIGMSVNALYNLVDTIFIGWGVGSMAIGGLAIAFPIQMIIMAFAQLVGIGAASAVSRSLGANDVERADHVTGNAFLSIIVLGSIISILGLSFTEPLLRIFGATNILMPYARDYISIILIGSVFFSFAVASNNLVRAEGNARVAAFTMIIGASLNIMLDPIFIFALDMGIKGAALATIVSQFISFLYVLRYMYSGKSSLGIKFKHLKPQKGIITEIFSVGFSAFARQAAGSFVAIILNNSLVFYGGELAVSVLGVVNRLLMFLFMPLFGVVQGMQPIVGFNYGAGKIERVKETVKLSMLTTMGFASIGWLIAQLFAPQIISIFTGDAQLISEGSKVLRIVVLAVPVIGIQVVGAALFQSLGKAVPSIILSLLRQVIIFIPLILILPRVWELELMGIWMSFPIADLLATIITAFLLRSEMKKIVGN